MGQDSWDKFFFDLVRVAASKSKDRSSKVGTVIVGPDHEVISLGYNGFSRGVDDDVEARHKRPLKYLYTEHAERNAIYNAARIGVPLKGTSIYLDWYPCARCARAIIQAGITELVVDGRGLKEKQAKWQKELPGRPGWKDDCDAGLEMLIEAGVKIRTALGPVTTVVGERSPAYEHRSVTDIG